MTSKHNSLMGLKCFPDLTCLEQRYLCHRHGTKIVILCKKMVICRAIFSLDLSHQLMEFMISSAGQLLCQLGYTSDHRSKFFKDSITSKTPIFVCLNFMLAFPESKKWRNKVGRGKGGSWKDFTKWWIICKSLKTLSKNFPLNAGTFQAYSRKL